MTVMDERDVRDVRDVRDERMAQIASAPARRRRAACAAAASVTLLVGWLTAHAVHDPLEQGAGVMAFGVAGEDFRLEPQQVLSNAFGSEHRVVTPAVGSHLGIALGLTNSGPVDVEILDVGFPFPDYYLADPQPFVSTAAGGSGPPYTAMEPFVLAPGEDRDVGMTFRMAGCPTGPVGRSAGALIADRVPVTWRWLGRTHVTDVPLSFRASLEGLPGCISR